MVERCGLKKTKRDLLKMEWKEENGCRIRRVSTTIIDRGAQKIEREGEKTEQREAWE